MNLIIQCLIFLFCLPGLWAQNIDSSLVAVYKFEGNVLDSGVYHNDGIANGNPVYVPGVSGQALAFDGSDDFVTVPGTNALHNISAEFTIAGWIKPFGVPDFYLPVLTKGNTADMNTPFAIVYRSPETTPYIRITGESMPFAAMNLSQFTNVVPFDTWTYFTWTFKAGWVTIYRNAEVIATQQFNFTQLATNTLPMDIGRDVPGFNTERLHGLLDELSIYNKALSRHQIEDLFNSYLVSSTKDQADQDHLFIQVSPNPAASQVTLTYGFDKAGFTDAAIFNSSGQLVKVLFKEQQDLKTNTLTFHTSDLISGVYHIIVNRNGKTLNKSLVVGK